MRKILFFIGIFLLLLACNKRKNSEDTVNILIHSLNEDYGDREGKDYIKLWVNDTLKFSGVFRVTFSDSTEYFFNACRMKVATVHRTNRDSIKIRVQLIALDSVLFAGKHVRDTTFSYRIDNIPFVSIDNFRQLNGFRIKDPVNNRESFYFE